MYRTKVWQILQNHPTSYYSAAVISILNVFAKFCPIRYKALLATNVECTMHLIVKVTRSDTPIDAVFQAATMVEILTNKIFTIALH